MIGIGAPPIWFRANHDLVGRVIAEKLRRRTDRTRIEDGFKVVGKGRVQ